MIRDFKIRLAENSDMAAVLMIRNDPPVVDASMIRRRITQEEHEKWWSKYIFKKNNSVKLFVVETRNFIVGYARIDFSSCSDEATLNIAIKEKYQRIGLGRILLSLVVKEAMDCGYSQIIANIRPENWGSTMLFNGLGFKPSQKTVEWRLR